MVYLYYLFGGVLSVLGLVGLGMALVFVCGSVGMDGLFNASEPRGELTCWHCGQLTRAGVRHCDRCGKELQ